MAKALDNKVAQCYRFILIVFNAILCMSGLTICILAGLLKWGNDFVKINESSELGDLGDFAKIGLAAIILFVIGALFLVISLIGIMGLCCLNKPLLIIYEIIVILLFIIHLAGLIYLLVSKTTIEDEFKKGMQTLTERLNSTNATTKWKNDCEAMKILSELFDCCGDKLSDDLDEYTKQECCSSKTNTTIGCTDKSIKTIEDNAKTFIIIPSSVILAVEFIVIVGTPLLCRSIFSRNY